MPQIMPGKTVASVAEVTHVEVMQGAVEERQRGGRTDEVRPGRKGVRQAEGDGAYPQRVGDHQSDQPGIGVAAMPLPKQEHSQEKPLRRAEQDEHRKQVEPHAPCDG